MLDTGRVDLIIVVCQKLKHLFLCSLLNLFGAAVPASFMTLITLSSMVPG